MQEILRTSGLGSGFESLRQMRVNVSCLQGRQACTVIKKDEKQNRKISKEGFAHSRVLAYKEYSTVLVSMSCDLYLCVYERENKTNLSHLFTCKHANNPEHHASTSLRVTGVHWLSLTGTPHAHPLPISKHGRQELSTAWFFGSCQH